MKRCNHKNVPSRQITILERVPTINGGHTGFVLMSCGECKKVFGFPQCNLLLTTEEFRKNLQTELTKKGYGTLDINPDV